MVRLKRVLIVDDDVEMANLIKDILMRQAACETVLAHNGVEAIDKSRSEKIDLILLDIRMPFFSGFWFCDAFKQRAETKDIPVVIVSALLDEDAVRKAYDAGASACLKKPFQPQELIDIVKRTLAGKN